VDGYGTVMDSWTVTDSYRQLWMVMVNLPHNKMGVPETLLVSCGELLSAASYNLLASYADDPTSGDTSHIPCGMWARNHIN
jgi:hypothetical protein